jgi:DNA-binding protein HU-beta
MVNSSATAAMFCKPTAKSSPLRRGAFSGRTGAGFLRLGAPKFSQNSACATQVNGFNTRKSQDDFSNQQTKRNTTRHRMAKALTKSQIAASIADNVGISKKQAVQTLETIAQLAYKNAKNTFTLPGLGKLVLVNRKARLGRNPATGEQIQIPAKRVVKFRVAKAAKEAILGAR